jgi:aminopeptidase N
MVLAALVLSWAGAAAHQGLGSPPAEGCLPLPEGEEIATEDWSVKGNFWRPRSAQSLDLAIATNQDDFDVTHYKLQLAFAPTTVPSTQIVSGTVTITGTSLVAGLAHIDLDFYDNMAISSIAAGATSLTFSRAGNVLTVNLDRAYAVSESWTVAITYSGHPMNVDSSFAFTQISGGSVLVASLSEPYGARTWWPCKDRPDDKATAEMIFTVPQTYTATSNGVLTGTTTDTGAGTKTYTWVTNYPITSYLISVAAYPYASFSHTYTPIGGGSMPVVYYVYPPIANAQISFSATPSMITYFAQKFGEYPFVTEKYGMSAFQFGGAMEHQGNTSYGASLINGTHSNDRIIAHELAHQWWGDAVSPRTWADIWLNEGFASYCEALWQENVGGVAAYKSAMQGYHHTTWGPSVYNPTNLFGTTVYHKGAWVQHMLRHVVGDTAFFQAQRDWYQNHIYGVGDTAGYQAQVEATSGTSLGWFFSEWVYGPSMPTYRFSWSVANTGAGFRLYLRVDQTQVNAPPFRMPIDIDVTTTSGTTRYQIVDSLASEDFQIPLTKAPTAVTFDPDNWVLKVLTNVAAIDGDGDGVPDRNDNCPGYVNGSQADFDSDALGDDCDLDDDNDQVLDGADCAPFDASGGSPPAIGGDAFTASVYSWTAAPLADRYDVTRGLLGASQAGDYGACLVTGVASTAVADPTLPPAGDGFLYLVRGVDDLCGGAGTWGFGSSGLERINANPSACP